MPSRSPSISPFPPPPLNHHRFVTPLTGGVVAAFSILLAFTLCFRKLSRKRTVPSDSKPPHRFSYADLRAATASFSAANRIGQGGFGSVYRGTLSNTQQVAVKVMDAGSLQGEREFQNELFFAGNVDCSQILSVIGFSSDRKRRRMLLVYELMANGSLQDCLLQRKCTELKDWKKRLSIAVDIAKGLEYLHHHCDPPIVHGDIKPSNILLDANFNAKIGDFGLARLKSEDQCVITVNSEFEGKKECNSVMAAEDNGSVVAETESVTTTCYEEFNGYGAARDLPESSLVVKAAEASPDTVIRSVLSPETTDAATASPATVLVLESPSDIFDKGSLSEANFDGLSMESEKESGVKKNRRGKKSSSGKDWWWKQDNTGAESGPVKDYVMEWIGTEIKKERPKSEWITAPSSSSGTIAKTEQKRKKKKSNKRRLDWWVSLDEEKVVKKEKRRPAREWWKEEYCEELARKNKKKKEGLTSTSEGISYDNYWPTDEDSHHSKKMNKRRSRSRGSLGSVDWWLDGLSGELWRGRNNSRDFSGDMHKSGGISSTPSMRGTVCYVAPEYSSGNDLLEKCDVYSFGVLLLVVIAGRRPLQVSGSPMSEFQRANLLSWSRHLARAGKLIDLVDQSVESVNKEEALMCITVALLCVQRSPALRPSMKEVVSMLSREVEPPQLPAELSPSRFAVKNRKKIRIAAQLRHSRLLAVPLVNPNDNHR